MRERDDCSLVANETVDSALNENEAELGVGVLAVAVEESKGVRPAGMPTVILRETATHRSRCFLTETAFLMRA